MALAEAARRVIAGAVALLAGAAWAPPGHAAPEDAVLKVPRFASLHSDKVNLRTGPGRQYPIEWVLTRKDMPVEITAQFEHWRRVREWDGTQGWVQEHMIANSRYVVVTGSGIQPFHQAPEAASTVVARAEPGVVARLLECRGEWCRIEAGDVAGWMARGDVWGVYPDEQLR